MLLSFHVPETEITHSQAVDECNQSKDETTAQHGEHRKDKEVLRLALWV